MNDLIIIFASLLFSAFFSGMEIAFISSNKLRIELEKKQELFPSKIISVFTKHPAQYIATTLTGNNISLVIYGIVMARLLEPPIRDLVSDSGSTILVIQTILSTLIILITAEFLPKTLFRINPNVALNIFCLPLLFFYIVLYPLSRFMIIISNLFLKNFLKKGIDKNRENIVFGKVDLDNFLSESQNGVPDPNNIEHDIKLFQNALDFSKVKLRECMVPRTEIEALEENDTIENLKQRFIETGYSKILIYKETIDNVIGYVHSSEIFKNPKNIKSKVVKISIVPETMPANKLLATFIKEHKSIALVVDEFGGTSGVVTIEDIMEEIFGEIVDEHDTVELEEKQLNENEYVLSGRHEIDYINEKYNLDLPESDDYETIAGFILFHHENIPNINDIIDIDNYSFHVLDVSDTRIELVKLTLIRE